MKFLNQQPLESFENDRSIYIDTATKTLGVGGKIALFKNEDVSSVKTNIRASTSLAADYTLTLPPTPGTAGQVLITDGAGNLSFTNGGGVGTVTSISGTGTVSGISLSGTITTDGDLTLSGTLEVIPDNFSTQVANTVLAGPISGSDDKPTFRALVSADFPTLNQNTSGSAGSVAAENITGTNIASNVTGSSLTSVGTLSGLTVSSDATINSVKLGRGGSSVATNIAIGENSVLGGNVDGSENVAIGSATLKSNRSGNSNTGVGNRALYTNRDGGANVGIGAYTVYFNLDGGYNTAVGNNALYTTTASFNTAIGGQAGSGITTGSGNTLVGYTAGNNITTGSKNVILGSYTGSTAPISGTGSNYIILSDGDGTVRQVIDSSGRVGIGTTSPIRALHVYAAPVSDGDSRTQVRVSSTVAYDASPIAGIHFGLIYNSANQSSGMGSIQFGKENSIDGDVASFFAVTTRINGGAVTERIRIDSIGNLKIASGNLNFSGTGQRITGDMSNATDANNLIFQSSTTNSSTGIRVAPNGTGTASYLKMFSSSDTANSSLFQFTIGGVLGAASLNSNINGTGTYLPMAFYTGGSERMRIDTSGNVGIGTSSPNAKLNVYSASTTANLMQWSSGGISDTNFITIAKSGALGTAGTPQFSLGMDYSTTYVDLCAIKFARDGGAGGNMQFFTGVNANGSERMRIDSSGNVGIGTTSPTSILEVASTTLGTTLNATQNNTTMSFRTDTNNTDRLVSKATRFAAGSDWTYANITLGREIAGTASGYPFITFGNNTAGSFDPMLELNVGSALLHMSYGGNVGIGTTSPAYSLDVKSTVNVGLRSLNSAATPSSTQGGGAVFGHLANTAMTSGSRLGFFVFTGTYDNTSTLYNASALTAFAEELWTGTARGSSLRFETTAIGTTTRSEKMRIDSSGNVGIGTTSPSYALDVSGSNDIARITSSTTSTGLLITDSVGTIRVGSRSGAAIFDTSSSERMRIDTTGNVGIGTYTDAGNALRYLDVQNSNTGAVAGAIVRLITSNYAGSGTTSADIVKYKTGGLIIKNTETNAAAYTAFEIGASERMRIDSSGNVTISGTLTVNGNTTTLNSNTLTVDDKNIEIGSVAAVTPTGNISAASAIVTNLSSTVNIVPGSAVTALSGNGTVTLPASTTVASIDSATQITLSQNLTGTGTATGATLTITGSTDVTANGGGITLKGASDKTLNWVSSTSAWTSSEHFNLASGKNYLLNGTNILASTTYIGTTSVALNRTSANMTLSGITSIDGGTSVSQALTIQSTTGVGTSDSIVFKTGNATTAMTINTSGTLILQGSASGNQLQFVTSSVERSRIGINGTSLEFHVNETSTPRMVIDSSGNVGIGTASPGYKLEIATSALIGSRLYPVSGTNGATYVVSNNGGNFYYGLDSSTGANFGAAYAGVLSHSGAYPILFATSSTERMRIDASGNVGIGTSSPSTYGKFGVVSGSTYFGVATDTYTSAIIGPRPANDGVVSFAFDYAAIGVASSFWKIDASASIFSIYQNANARLNIDSSGNVGIGTSSSSAPLTVSSSTTIAAGLPSILLQGSSNTERIAIRTTSGPVFVTQFCNGTLASPTAVTSGNFLGGYQFGGYAATAFNRGAQISGYADGTWTDTSTPAYITLATASAGSTTLTERMRIDSSGKALIGLTASKTYGNTLQVQGGIQNFGVNSASVSDIIAYDYNSVDASPTFASAVLRKYGSTATGNLYIAGTIAAAGWAEISGINTNGLGIGTNGAAPIVFGTTATERMRIDSSGNVGIGTTTPAQKLHVVGNIVATGDITTAYSDDRLKNISGPITNALNKVNTLSGFYYTPNDLAISLGIDDNQQLRVGVSAQQVQAIMPEVVKESPIDKDYLTVQYEKLVPLLIEAIKELTAKVAELEKRNN